MLFLDTTRSLGPLPWPQARLPRAVASLVARGPLVHSLPHELFEARLLQPRLFFRRADALDFGHLLLHRDARGRRGLCRVIEKAGS